MPPAYNNQCRRQYETSVADRPYAKETAIRVLLHRLDVLARRRGRRVSPLLCVALDFYVGVDVVVVSCCASKMYYIYGVGWTLAGTAPLFFGRLFLLVREGVLLVVCWSLSLA